MSSAEPKPPMAESDMMMFGTLPSMPESDHGADAMPKPNQKLDHDDVQDSETTSKICISIMNHECDIIQLL